MVLKESYAEAQDFWPILYNQTGYQIVTLTSSHNIVAVGINFYIRWDTIEPTVTISIRDAVNNHPVGEDLLSIVGVHSPAFGNPPELFRFPSYIHRSVGDQIAIVVASTGQAEAAYNVEQHGVWIACVESPVGLTDKWYTRDATVPMWMSSSSGWSAVVFPNVYKTGVIGPKMCYSLYSGDLTDCSLVLKGADTKVHLSRLQQTIPDIGSGVLWPGAVP